MFLAKLCPSLPIIWKLLWFISGRQLGSCSPSSRGRKQFSGISGRQSGFPGSRQASNSPFPQGRRQSSSFPSLPDRHSPSLCWGKLPKQVSQAIKALDQAGNTLGTQPGKGPSRLPRGTALPLR